ncbi:MAG: hypothetical protein ABR500_08075 [Dermatophilaceae bacterium]|nr:hypothetical protein [Intrasporangiaceae bacterium]
MTATSFVVALSSGDVSLVLDLGDGGLPVVVHWGERLDGLSEADLSGLALTGVALPGLNVIDAPPRLAVLPEHARGWLGRPGLAGSRGGRAWSTQFVVDRVVLDEGASTATPCQGLASSRCMRRTPSPGSRCWSRLVSTLPGWSAPVPP